MELPRGIFWIMAASGTPETYVLSLMRMADALYREVLIITDLPASIQPESGKVVLNGEPEGEYHYMFATDSRAAIGKVQDELFPLMSPRGWKCWMPPRTNDPISWDDAKRDSNSIISQYPFDAVCEPNVAVNVGPNRDVIFSKSGVMSSVMSPHSGDGFWREIFRSSGCFGGKATIVKGEM
jgi:hypothetical protein